MSIGGRDKDKTIAGGTRPVKLLEPVDEVTTADGSPTTSSSLRRPTPSPRFRSSTMGDPVVRSGSPGFGDDSQKAGPSNLSPDTAQKSRVRALSTVSTSASSISSNSGVVSEKRQQEFAKHFDGELRPVDMDSYNVIATQSTDLQSGVLVHGRLYLTPHHLCFRSNILGIVTKKIHPLRDMVGLEKGTTAKWIQNAIYVYMVGEDKYIGYGSLRDRDAMYDDILEAWKLVAPERVEQAEQSGRLGMSKGKGSGDAGSSSSSLASSASSSSSVTMDATPDSSVDKAPDAPKKTECSGEHYKESAVDTTFALPLQDVFDLAYKNKEFTMKFYTEGQGLKNVEVGDWENGDDGEERILKYIMTINNPVGPNESDCWGKETVVISDPAKSFEILSETRTPGLPAGKNFTVKTRTCLTHTEKNGKPATRMHSTSQCDWSGFHMLKSTITPAVIKGQKSYYEKLSETIRQWVRDHPDDFGGSEAVAGDSEIEAGVGNVNGGATKEKGGLGEGGGAGVEVKTMKEEKSLTDHTMDIPNNPVAASVSVLCVLFLLRELYWLLY